MTALPDLPGAPESRLAPGVLVPLPATTPAPPWPCRVQAVVWWHLAGPAAVAALPAALRACARLPLVGAPLVVGAMVRYLDSPVGPYDEVVAAVLHRPLRVHVPFLAVDSPASLHGGRTHWALPKALGAFRRREDGGGGVEGVAQGDGWRIAATALPRGPRLPVLGLLALDQVDAGGQRRTARVSARGRARPGRVLVQVGTDLAGRPGSIAGWLRSGRHPGVVLTARLQVGSVL